MLSNAQIDHFRTFGYVPLPNFLGVDRAGALRDEVDAAIRDAYAPTYDERVEDGISGHYLPMASRCTPLSASLVCDDPLLVDAAAQLLGTGVLPSVPEGVLYFGDAGWHDDDGIGVHGVKFATYFDRLEGANGALRFVPCSHHDDGRMLLRAYQRAGYDEFPAVVVDSRPGDVVAFDLHTFHAASGGRDRLAWTTVYVATPDDEASRARTLRWMTDAFEQAFRGFDRERYPVWRDWLTDPDGRRGRVIEGLRAAGVLDLPGAELGW
jgi:hypothetical protein